MTRRCLRKQTLQSAALPTELSQARYTIFKNDENFIPKKKNVLVKNTYTKQYNLRLTFYIRDFTNYTPQIRFASSIHKNTRF